MSVLVHTECRDDICFGGESVRYMIILGIVIHDYISYLKQTYPIYFILFHFGAIYSILGTTVKA